MIKERIRRFFRISEEGIGVIEIILILVILISLILIFRDQISQFVQSALQMITNDSGSIINDTEGKFTPSEG